MKLKFEKVVQEARLRSPLQGFKEVVQRIEVRKDPLSGELCRINVERVKRPRQTATSAECIELVELIEGSEAKCFFCPDSIKKTTPMFAEGLPDRIKVGDACLFPNLFPFGGYHAVGVLSKEHCLKLDQFKPKMIEDCFKACLQYFELIHERHKEIKYWHINWNHLPPSGASIIHPHVQIFADSRPTPHLQKFIEMSKAYHRRNKSNYWSDLVDTERSNKARFIGKTGQTSWLTSFAPQGNKEVTAVFSSTSSLDGLCNRGLSGFCDGLSSILEGYNSIGVQSFNFSTFSGPCDEDLSKFYLLSARIIARPNPAPFYTNDNGFMERFHHEPIIETMPEDLAKELRTHF